MSKRELKYQIIKDDILEQIRTGVLQPGEKIPSESQLKAKYGVSTITVRKAFSELIRDGYLVGIQGQGTFVSKKQLVRSLTSISFSKELEQQGFQTSQIIDTITQVEDPRIASLMDLPKETALVRVARIRLANKQPVAYHISYMDVRRLPLEEARQVDQYGSFYKMLEEKDLKVDSVLENYSVKMVDDPRICHLMQVDENYPSFFVKRASYDEKGDIIEYCETYFNNEWYSVTINIHA